MFCSAASASPPGDAFVPKSEAARCVDGPPDEEHRWPHLPCPRHAWGSSYWLPGRLSSSYLWRDLGGSLFSSHFSLCLSLSLREVGMHACGHPDWGAITFVAGRAGVVEARGGKPCRSYILTWSPRVSGSARLNCTDAVQIGKDRLSCLFVFFVLILLFPHHGVSDVPMQAS